MPGEPVRHAEEAKPMRVAIAGAGKVGQWIARALLGSGHKVLLIERERPHFRPARDLEQLGGPPRHSVDVVAEMRVASHGAASAGNSARTSAAQIEQIA